MHQIQPAKHPYSPQSGLCDCTKLKGTHYLIMRSPPSLLHMIRVVGNDISYFFTFGRHKNQIPIIIRNPQRTIENMDIGPVISFTGFPAITSNMQTNIAPRMPTAISIMPFAFIYYFRLSAIQTKRQL